MAFVGKNAAAAVNEVQKDHVMSRCTMSVNEGGLAEVNGYLQANEPPNLLIIEVAEKGEDLISALDGLANVCPPETKVILIGTENDVHLYRRLMDMGISEYLPGKVSKDELISTIRRTFSEMGEDALGRVIAFMGVRGGVGSSSLALNTAYHLAHHYRDRTILVDADVRFGTAALSLNLAQKQSVVDALADPNSLDEVLMERVMIDYDEFLAVLASPATVSADPDVAMEALDNLINLARRLAGYVVVDLPHDWAHWEQDLLIDAHETVICAYPDLANLRDAKSVLEFLKDKRNGQGPARLLLNSVGRSRKTELSAKDFEDTTKFKPTMEIPFDPDAFGNALNNGASLSQIAKSSKATQAIDKLAESLAGKAAPPPEKKKKSGFSLFGGKK